MKVERQPECMGDAVAIELRAVRMRLGVQQGELARRAGMTQGMLSRIESGRVRMFVVHLWTLARALDVPASRVLRGAERRWDRARNKRARKA